VLGAGGLVKSVGCGVNGVECQEWGVGCRVQSVEYRVKGDRHPSLW
jgi:hypothetical protein